jgi:hypothetical protein
MQGAAAVVILLAMMFGGVLYLIYSQDCTARSGEPIGERVSMEAVRVVAKRARTIAVLALIACAGGLAAFVMARWVPIGVRMLVAAPAAGLLVQIAYVAWRCHAALSGDTAIWRDGYVRVWRDGKLRSWLRGWPSTLARLGIPQARVRR